MQVVFARCAGLDVHKKTVVVTVLLTASNGAVSKETRTFSTMTADLLRLEAWLSELAVAHLAMESTGVYWYPIYNLLEEGRTILLVNPQHIKAVPGRKTDVRDSEWLADLLRHGLLAASFIPPKPIRELREVTRYRKQLVNERIQYANRLQKVLESANIKLAVVASDILGVSGRAMLDALIAGEQEAVQMAEHARGRMRRRIPDLCQALEGRVTSHHRFLLRQLLKHIDGLDQEVAEIEHQIATYLQPYEEASRLLQTIPGIGAPAAAALISEIGVDMSRFPSAKHLASWAGVCPGNNQSGGKRRPAGTTGGNRWVRAILGEVVWVISRTKGTYLAAQFQRLMRRRGKYKAVIAVAHTVLVIIYHMLRDHVPYADLGPDYFDQLDKARVERHHVRRLEQLGYTVSLSPAVA
jgi:transposase